VESIVNMRQISPLSYLADVVLGVEGLRVAAQVRLTHLELQGRDDRHTEAVLNDLRGLEDRITKLLAVEMAQHPAWPWLEQVKGAGLENSAKVIGIIEGVTFRATGRSSIAAFDTMSKLRRFAGLAPIDGKAEKRTKGEKLHYSSELRTMLWRMGGGLIKTSVTTGKKRAPTPGGKFCIYYNRRKDEYTERFIRNGYKILPTPTAGWKCKNCQTGFEKKRDVTGCCTDPLPEKRLKQEGPNEIFLGHLDNMAKRKMVVMFSDMLWMYWRGALGLPCKPSYIVGKEPVRQHQPEDFIG